LFNIIAAEKPLGVVPKSWIVENELPVSMCSANTSIMKNIIINAPHTMKRSG
jgi:hypothetical protein